MSESSKINRQFCKVMFREAKKDLQEILGKKKVRELLENNMDVMQSSTFRGTAFIHWVKDKDLIKEDLYKEESTDNIWEARYEAISFLREHLAKDPRFKKRICEIDKRNTDEIEARQKRC